MTLYKFLASVQQLQFQETSLKVTTQGYRAVTNSSSGTMNPIAWP